MKVARFGDPFMRRTERRIALSCARVLRSSELARPLPRGDAFLEPSTSVLLNLGADCRASVRIARAAASAVLPWKLEAFVNLGLSVLLNDHF